MKYSDMEVVSISFLILRKSPPSFSSTARRIGQDAISTLFLKTAKWPVEQSCQDAISTIAAKAPYQ
jgi:hypothetical protein